MIKQIIFWRNIFLIEKKLHFIDFRSDSEEDPNPDPLFHETDPYPYQNETDPKH